jgi:transcriptional regulator with XRE-family HTH domain
MAKKVRTINDQISDAIKGQAAAKAAKAAAKPKATAPKAEKAAPKAKATRKPGNLRTTGLPNKVRSLRLKASLSPAQLADKAGAGLTASYVRRIERGVRHATEAQVTALAKALGTEAGTLGIKDAKPVTAKAPRQPKNKPVEVPADLQPGEAVAVDMETGEVVTA